MVARARLAAPPAEVSEDWPHHQCKWASLSAHLLWKGDRRMEAENYLSSGYGLRLAIEERAAGWRRLGQMARVTQPGRTKGILVAPEHGVPWLAATQIYDIRPIPRKWMATEKVNDAAQLFVKSGTILVTRSGSVGRATIAQDTLNGILVSDDLLRVEPVQSSMWGWLYAYLRSPQARAMMTGAQYGHIIKHLETGHLDALPVPIVTEEHAQRFLTQTETILSLRNRSYQLTLEAEARFEKAIGSIKVKDWGEEGFSVKASALFGGRRRLEAIPYNPGAAMIWKHLTKHGKGFLTVQEAGFDVWLPTRFRRVPAEDGVWFMDSADLFETNPDVTKKIADLNFGDQTNGRVKPGWLLLARSGQTYGINGSLVLATEALADTVISDHVMRVAPRSNAQLRAGYVLTALSHPQLGRPLVKSLAYGSSIPEIDPTDFSNHRIVRLAESEENAIADLAEESASLRAQADVLEREMAAEAGRLIDGFLAGDVVHFVVTMPSPAVNAPAATSSALPEHAVVRLRHDLKTDGLKAGDMGTIVHVYEGGSGYEVEFIQGRKRPKLVTVEPADLELAD